MRRLCIVMLLLQTAWWSSGCVSAKIQVVDERTALENQILGSYEELERDQQLVASVRGVSEDGKRKQTQKFSDVRAGAVAARQTQQFNLDDIEELKQAGCLGETNDGQLTARPCDTGDQTSVSERIERLVASENQARLVLIEFVVTTSPDLTTDDRAQLIRAYARMNREQAKSGHWTQTDAGEWVRK